jgi:hypothetical protein
MLTLAPEQFTFENGSHFSLELTNIPKPPCANVGRTHAPPAHPTDPRPFNVL